MVGRFIYLKTYSRHRLRFDCIYAASICISASMIMGSSFGMERNLDVDLRVYTIAGDVALDRPV